MYCIGHTQSSCHANLSTHEKLCRIGRKKGCKLAEGTERWSLRLRRNPPADVFIHAKPRCQQTEQPMDASHPVRYEFPRRSRGAETVRLPGLNLQSPRQATALPQRIRQTHQRPAQAAEVWGIAGVGLARGLFDYPKLKPKPRVIIVEGKQARKNDGQPRPRETQRTSF